MSLQPQQPNIKLNTWGALALGGELGFLIALPLVICLLIGAFLDKKMNSFPLYILILLLVGIILTIANIYKIILPFLEKKVGRKENNSKNLKK
jgi:F0F1-type ATP synthase assembly protein I